MLAVMNNANDTQNESMMMAEAHELISPNINSKSQPVKQNDSILAAVDKREQDGLDDNMNLSEIESSDHSSDRRHLDIEIQNRSAVFRKPTMHKPIPTLKL